MLQLNKMSWRENTLDGGIVELVGGLSMHVAHRIAPEYLSEKAEVKRRMRLQIWRDTYGELTQPIRELQLYARRAAAYGEDGQLKELCDTINRLLEPPPEKQRPSI